MNPGILAWLQSPEGQYVLAQAAAGDQTPAGRLRTLEYLRRLAPPEQATAAYELALLRSQAQVKFPQAAQMFFVREALEQASGSSIASYRARRYQPYAGAIADLCCGIGGDSMALAALGTVTAVDNDPLRLALAAANAAVLGLATNLRLVEADLEQTAPPAAEALFFDPARRVDGQRVFRLAAYRPAVMLVQDWRKRTPAIGVKLAPGVQEAELQPFQPYQLEFISVDGALKEALLWLGPLAEPQRQASLLFSDQTQPALFTWPHDQPLPQAVVTAPSAYLYEPDPAIIRAGLVGPLAHQIGATQIDPSIAYMTSDTLVSTPFARCWRVLEWMPFSLKRLTARLRSLDAGAITVKKRGSAIDSDALARRLCGPGQRPLVVVLSLVAGRHAALICEGPVGV